MISVTQRATNPREWFLSFEFGSTASSKPRKELECHVLVSEQLAVSGQPCVTLRICCKARLRYIDILVSTVTAQETHIVFTASTTVPVKVSAKCSSPPAEIYGYWQCFLSEKSPHLMIWVISHPTEHLSRAHDNQDLQPGSYTGLLSCIRTLAIRI